MLCATASMAVAQGDDWWNDTFDEAEDAEAFALFAGTMCMIFWVVWFIIWILIAIWVYKDAESRGASGVLWLIVVILLGLIGLIIYLVVRPKQQAPPPGYTAPPPGYAPPPGQYPPPQQYPPQQPPPGQYPPQQPPPGQ